MNSEIPDDIFGNSQCSDEALSPLVEPTLTRTIVERAQVSVIGSVLRVKVGQIA